VNFPAQFVARTAGLDAHDPDGPSPTAYPRNDTVSIEVERDWAMAGRKLKLDLPTVETAVGAFQAALPAEIPYHAAHLLPRNADLGGRELPVDPFCLSMGRRSER
jgi:hypothetical protein